MSNFITGKSVIIDGHSVVLNKNKINILAFFKFESMPFMEEVSSQFVNNTGTSSPIIETGVFGNGCRFRPMSSFEFPMEIKKNNSLSFGFWLNSKNILPSVSSSGGEKVYYRTPLFDKASLSYSSSSGLVSMIDGSFCVYEECKDENKNIIRIHMMNEDGEEFVAYSDEYECDILHYFWISYSGLNKKISIFIDGIEKDFYVESGQVPETINYSNGTFLSFNRSAIGNNSILRNSVSLLDELIFINECINDKYVIASHINNGSEYAIQESLSLRRESIFGFLFDDPTSLRITSIFSGGNYIYAGMNNGSIFKGDRYFWESRRDFSSSEEEKYLEKSFLSKDSIISFDDGSLKIFKANIQIR